MRVSRLQHTLRAAHSCMPSRAQVASIAAAAAAAASVGVSRRPRHHIRRRLRRATRCVGAFAAAPAQDARALRAIDPRRSAPLRPVPGASADGAAPQPSLHLRSTCPPLSPRALMRARYGGAALGLSSSGQLVPVQRPTDGADSARACFAGAAAKAPTQRAARRNRRRMWSLGLRLDAQGDPHPSSTPNPACPSIYSE